MPTSESRSRHEVRLARLPMFFSSAKAERELGYASSPFEPALRDAVREALVGTDRALGVLFDEFERPAPGV